MLSALSEDAAPGPNVDAKLWSALSADAAPSAFASAIASGGAALRPSSALVDLRSAPHLHEHAMVHGTVGGLSLAAARSFVDCRLASVVEADLSTSEGCFEPEGMSDEVTRAYRQVIALLDRGRRELAARIAERLSPDVVGELTMGLRPMAARTRVYFTANCRAVRELVAKLLAHSSPEVRGVGAELKRACADLSPAIMEDVVASAFRVQARRTAEQVAARVCEAPTESATATMVISQPVRLVRHDKDALERIGLALLYEGGDASQHAFVVTSGLRKLREAQMSDLLREAVSGRIQGEPLPRAFEAAHITLELMADFATCRELSRHRLVSGAAQRLSCSLGFQTPDELLDVGLAEPYMDVMLAAQDAWSKMEAKFPPAAEYLVPIGFRTRVLWTLHVRSLVHVIENRARATQPTRVRRIAHGLFRTASSVYPWLRDIVRLDKST